MREMELTILDVTQLNKRMKFLDIAKQHAPVGKEKLREALKQAEATFDQQTKRWQINEDHPNAQKRVLDFVRSTRAKDPLRVDPVTEQSQLDDGYFEIEMKQEKVVRKKVSLDLDVALHKRLKHIALENDMKLYELVEGVLQDYASRQKQ